MGGVASCFTKFEELVSLELTFYHSIMSKLKEKLQTFTTHEMAWLHLAVAGRNSCKILQYPAPEPSRRTFRWNVQGTVSCLACLLMYLIKFMVYSARTSWLLQIFLAKTLNSSLCWNHKLITCLGFQDLLMLFSTCCRYNSWGKNLMLMPSPMLAEIIQLLQWQLLFTECASSIINVQGHTFGILLHEDIYSWSPVVYVTDFCFLLPFFCLPFCCPCPVHFQRLCSSHSIKTIADLCSLILSYGIINKLPWILWFCNGILHFCSSEQIPIVLLFHFCNMRSMSSISAWQRCAQYILSSNLKGILFKLCVKIKNANQMNLTPFICNTWQRGCNLFEW